MTDPRESARVRQVIWARSTRAGKGPAPALTRDQLAAASVRIADAEGVDQLSMRKVALTLGVAAASLYRYVDSKDELFDVMVDWVEGEMPAAEPSGEWREDLSSYARDYRAVILRHPWMTSIAASRPNFGPRSLEVTERGLAALDALGLDVDRRLIAGEVVNSFVRGFVARELAETQAWQRTGSSRQEWADSLGPYIARIVEERSHPRFSDTVISASLPHDETRERLFHDSLSLIIESVAALGKI